MEHTEKLFTKPEYRMLHMLKLTIEYLSRHFIILLIKYVLKIWEDIRPLLFFLQFDKANSIIISITLCFVILGGSDIGMVERITVSNIW